MNQQEAEEIANDWKYDNIYSFYDMTADKEDFLEFIDSSKPGNKCFSCYLGNELFAYYSIDIIEESEAELGLGLKPDFTGKGHGINFVNSVINHATSMYGICSFTLSVALFNERAIKVYKKAGFVEDGVFIQKTNGGDYEFLKMIKCADSPPVGRFFKECV